MQVDNTLRPEEIPLEKILEMVDSSAWDTFESFLRRTIQNLLLQLADSLETRTVDRIQGRIIAYRELLDLKSIYQSHKTTGEPS